MIQKELIPNTNFNLVSVTGMYSYGLLSDYTNAPAGTGDYGVLEVVHGNNNYVIQRATGVSTGNMQVRTSTNNGSTWRAWRTVTLT